MSDHVHMRVIRNLSLTIQTSRFQDAWVSIAVLKIASTVTLAGQVPTVDTPTASRSESWLPSYGLMAFVNGDAKHELIPRDEHQEMVRKQV